MRILNAATALLMLYPIAAFATNGPVVGSVVSTADANQQLAVQATSQFKTGQTLNSTVITINDTNTYQTMRGFGASMTDTAAYALYKNESTTQFQSTMKTLFGPRSQGGINLSFIRIPIGPTDEEVTTPASLDDNAGPTGACSSQLTYFSIAHDTNYIIPTLQYAFSINPNITTEAVPWTPPAWMKLNNSLYNTSSPATTSILNPNYMCQYSQYLRQFVLAYNSYNIPITALAIQNEPLNVNTNTGFPTATMTDANVAINFINNNYTPEMAKWVPANQIPAILGYEHNWDNTAYPEAVLAGAGANMLGTSFHCYSGVATPQSEVNAKYPTKEIWSTECSIGINPNVATNKWAQYGFVFALDANIDVIGPAQNWSTVVGLWNIATDQNMGPTYETSGEGCTGCRGLLRIDTSTNPPTVKKMLEYNIIGHLSAYVMPGAVRIQSTDFGSTSLHLYSVAFQNPDGSQVLIVYNADIVSHSYSVAEGAYAYNATALPISLQTYYWPSYSF